MIRIKQIKIPVDVEQKMHLEGKILKRLGISSSDLQTYIIHKQSLDARHDEPFYVYEVDATVLNEKEILKKRQDGNLFLAPDETYHLPPHGTVPLKHRPVVVGSGPAGLFASYLLAEEGYQPLIIERGDAMEERITKVESFWNNNVLDTESNVSFGEGGAGTFSDGKLNTLVKDPFLRSKKVFDIFVENGADEEIKYVKNPHIGTDRLRSIVVNMRKKIIEMGGTFLFRTKLTDIVIENEKITKIIVNEKEEIPVDVLILAIGHSARDTFTMLYRKKIPMTSKPFAVGVRISHLQKDINESQYGKYASFLPPASYKLTYTTQDKRGVYSFCMCPGGYVVNASSEEKGIAINGMSNYRRDTESANSALVVTVDAHDFGPGVLDGVKFQRTLEEKAYRLGNGKIPTQLLGDFRQNKLSTQYQKIYPVVKGSTSFANLNELFPSYINEALLESLPYFGKKIKGFDQEDALLMGIESRTSSPVRILRDEHLESEIKGLYPCGEGAGYAGGITTSAMDGVKVAEEIVKKYL